MSNTQGTANAASQAVDVRKVEREAYTIGARLKEPSTYGGLAMLLGLIFHVSNAAQLALNIQNIGMACGVIILSLLAIFVPEKKTGGKPMAVITAFIIGSLVLFGMSTARAADMATKAPLFNTTAAPSQTFITGTGWFVGVGTEAGVASSSVSGSTFPSLSAGSLTASGAAAGAGFGYINKNCIAGNWCMFQIDGFYQNINGGLASSGSVESQWQFGEEFDVSATWLQNIFSTLGTNLGLSFPVLNPSGLLPANLKVANPQPYLGFRVEQDLVTGQVGTAAGQTWEIPIGLTSGIVYNLPNSAGALTNTSLNLGGKIMWASQGAELTGVFATPGGAPLAVHSGAGLDTIYAVFMKLNFGVPGSL